MKRTLIAVSLLLILLAGLWFAGPKLFQGAAAPGVAVDVDGAKSALVLTVDHPGLFVDVRGAAIQAAAVNGSPVTPFSPWPKSGRLRVMPFFRGPVRFDVAVGAGPFDLRDLPQSVTAKAFSVPAWPDGWRQAGHYVGQFDELKGDQLTVMVPHGMPRGAEAADAVRKLYPAAEKLFGRAPVRERTAVVTGPEPAALARAVVELWIPEYAPDARWWEDGAVDFYTVKLLDQTKSWSVTERTKWMRANVAHKGYAVALWLDGSLRTDPTRRDSMDTLLKQALSARTEAQVIESVRSVGGVGLRNLLDRILEGKDPLPVTEHS